MLVNFVPGVGNSLFVYARGDMQFNNKKYENPGGMVTARIEPCINMPLPSNLILVKILLPISLNAANSLGLVSKKCSKHFTLNNNYRFFVCFFVNIKKEK